MATSSGAPIITPETALGEYWSPSPVVTRNMCSSALLPAAVRQAELLCCEPKDLRTHSCHSASPGLLAHQASEYFILGAS